MPLPLTASQVLKAVEDKEALLPTVHVPDRSLEQEKDLGNILGWDENEINSKIAINHEDPAREDYLTNLARDNTQVKYILSTRYNLVSYGHI